MKLDLLVICAHPDDAELSCGGLLLKLAAEGKKCGVIDLTRGEMGTRGTAETRAAETAEATKILNLAVRGNLGLRDGFFQNDEAHQLAVIRAIRQYQPDVVITNAPTDRHPDHGKGAALVKDAAFLSGLVKIETEIDGLQQAAWRPKQVYHFLQDVYLTPSFVVDITPYFEQKMAAVRAYATQFFNPAVAGPETHISKPTYLNYIEARARAVGHLIGAEFGEGFISNTMIRLDSPLSQI